MTDQPQDQSKDQRPENLPVLKNKVRFVTATALFDGHDASINIMRRLLQQGGAEVIHLGHNRSVLDIATAAVQEDVQAIAVSSYQGGHVEFFKYLREICDGLGRKDICLFGGGGGVIIPEEIAELERSGVTKIYSPEDGRKLGLLGMIGDMMVKADYPLQSLPEVKLNSAASTQQLTLARRLTLLENKIAHPVPEAAFKKDTTTKSNIPLVLGITGTGGAGKSSLTDEIIRRFALEFPERKLCVFSVDPSKKKTGGALLGDRIRMNAIGPNVFMRSFATRGTKGELSEVMGDALRLAKGAGFDLIFVETSGIGQADTGILSVCDLSLYVMTSEFGAATQLEKIDMLDFADVIAINKFDRRGAQDAFRDVCAQVRRSRFQGRHMAEHEFPVFGTIASKFNDDGVNGLYARLKKLLSEKANNADSWPTKMSFKESQKSSYVAPIIPQGRTNYLSEIAQTVRDYHKETNRCAEMAETVQALRRTLALDNLDVGVRASLEPRLSKEKAKIPETVQHLLRQWPGLRAKYQSGVYSYEVRGKKFENPTTTTSLSGLPIPRVSVPTFENDGFLVRYLRSENLPGSFPFTAGVYPFKREDEDPKRQFAGEGGPKRTNRRFLYLTKSDTAKRLSTAFDSVTLYGEDPAKRPDIFGKVGESGVSIATLADMKELFQGFDLCDANTSVSMTINGPAPIILAFFFNAAFDQQVDVETTKLGRKLSAQELTDLRARTFKSVRGTVQADILKEDQAQNTCIFSTDFALKMMGDVQEYFVQQEVRNYYSVSISGYHIAEAGANPISQLAFTLANGFTYVEYYLSRGMEIDDFASNLSFFFSNGMDPEYSVIGRVARRIWSIAMRDKYKANERSQKLKYHIQTSGRSLHAQEIDFNDVRTTLQALLAFSDNCNSLHTNAYDEAITTPTEESVRRSMAIQLILLREFGVLKNQNFFQGSYFIEQVTDLVENAVLEEFDRISARGGVLGAMETQYQRGKIQEESLAYETLKHSGELPIVGVNTFLNPRQDENGTHVQIELARASYEEKNEQLERVEEFRQTHATKRDEALKRLQNVVLSGSNIFAELLETTRHATLGEITKTLYQVGGQYRRAL